MQRQVATAPDGTALEIQAGGVAIELFEDGEKVAAPDGEFWPSMREARAAAHARVLARSQAEVDALNAKEPGSVAMGSCHLTWRTE